jgi:peptide/nickel transport system substrate-binding protein
MSDSNKSSRRNFLKATGAAATAVAVAGCSGQTDSDTETDAAGGDTETETETSMDTETETESESGGDMGGDTLQLINSTMSTLDPIKSTDTASGTVVQQLYDALTNYPNGEIATENLLATGFETSSDFTTYTITIKEGATFHNGDEVTAQDFVYSFERLAQSSNSRRQYFILDSLGVQHNTMEVTQDGETQTVYEPGSIAVEAVDDYTLEMDLEKPFASTLPMLAYTSFAVIPEGIVGDIEQYDGEMDYEEFASSNPIGCGPFTFETWETQTEAEVSRYDDYHGNVADISAVHWQIIPDPNAAFSYANNKNADIFGIPTAQYDPSRLTVDETDDLGRDIGTYEMNNGSTVDYVGVATINSFYIGFNQKNIDERAVRRAVAYALNQQTAVDQVFKGRGSTAYHFTPPNIYPGGAPAYRDHAENNYPYGYNETNLQRAREIMRNAGYGPNNRYEFTFTTYQSPTWQQIGQILRDQLASAFIDMNLEEAPFSTLLSRGREGNLQAFSLGWIMDWPAPDNFLQNLVPELTITSQEGGARGAYVDWDVEESDAAQRASDAWDQITDNPEPTDSSQEVRNEAYVEMEEANWTDVVLLPVYHRIDQRFNYSWTDVPRFGGAGTSRMMYNNTTVGTRE